MAALESTRVVRFALPLSDASFCNGNPLWPAKPSRAIRSPTSSQKARRPAATPSRSGYQAEADRNTAASEGRKRALAVSDDESDDDLPSLEELSRTVLRPKTSAEASKTESTAQRSEPPALDEARLQVDQTQPRLGGYQGGSRDQLMILDDNYSDEAEGASGEVVVNTGRIGRDTSPHNTLATSELASGPTKSIDTSGPWYDVEEGCYIDELAPRLGSWEEQGATSAPAQDWPQTLPQTSQPLQDQTNQQNVGNITQSMSVEPAPYSLPDLPNNGDNGWTNESTAELEKELELALEEQQVESSLAGTATSPSPRSVEAPQDETQSREGTETTRSRPEELQAASRHGAAQDLEEWGQRETEVVVVQGGGVATQSEVHLRHSATPTSDEHRYASRASQGYSALAEIALEVEPAAQKRVHQEMHTEISSETHHSANTGDNHNTCDTDDEDPRPAKRRKPRVAPAVTPAICHRRTPEPRLGGPGPLVALSATTPEIDDAQPQADNGCPSTFVDDGHHYASRTSRSPSAAAEAVPGAEYQEWPFQGFLKRTRIGDDVTYNLEFKLPSISEHLHLPIDPKALDICSSKEAPAKAPTHHDAAPHSKIYQTLLQPQKRRVRWTTAEDATVLKMRNDGCSWEEIHNALPHRSIGTIQVRYSTKLKE